jgi:glycosyltransferase involved in cell wall biosynthesis
VPGKGIETLLRAFRSVVEEEPGSELRIAGDGPQRARLADLIEAQGATRYARLVGVVDDLPSFLSDVDVAVMPSELPESFGMVALEAMASGKPVVATSNGGVPELVDDGVTGRLVPRGDERALAAALLGYVRDPALRADHGAAGRTRCEREFTIERCAAAYARLFAELGGTALPSAKPAREAVHA